MGADDSSTTATTKKILIDLQRQMTWYYKRFNDLKFAEDLITHFINQDDVPMEIIDSIVSIIDYKIRTMEEHYKEVCEGLSGLRITMKSVKDKPSVDSSARLMTPERNRDF